MRRTVSRRPPLRVECLEDRTMPFVTLFAAAAGASGLPLVNVYEMDTPTSYHRVVTFLAYEASFRGGVNVSVADITGDSIDDVVVGPGPGRAPTVEVFDGAALLKGQVVKLRSFNAYDPAFLGGVYVAAEGGGSVQNFIITGAGAGGGPHVRVFDSVTLAVTRQFYAYDPNFRGGVRVGTSFGFLITGAGPGGGPHVKVYNDNGSSLNTQFYAFAPSFTGGVFVAGSGGLTLINGGPPGSLNLIVTAGPGGPPEVRLYADNTNSRMADLRFTLVPYPNFGGGISAAVAQDNSLDGSKFLVTAPGPGGGPDVRLFRDDDFQPVLRFNAFSPDFIGGVNVGSAR